MSIFQVFNITVVCVFMGIMLLVSIVAFSRHSGSTGLSMAKIQQMRFEVTAQKE